VATSLTHGRALRYAGGSVRGLLHHVPGHCRMTPPEMRRLRQLEDENAKLKRIVADLSLDKEMLQDVIRRKI
jgi:putative transposase